MKIKTDDTTRAQIGDFLPRFQSALDALSQTTATLADLDQRDAKNRAQQASLMAAEHPTDKQIVDQLVYRERERIHHDLREKYDRTSNTQKAAVVALATDASELVRAAAGKQLFHTVEQDLIASLPEVIRKDDALLFRMVNENSAKRTVARFLNSQPLSQRDDAETILIEGARLDQLLDDLRGGREITVPGIAEVPASA